MNKLSKLIMAFFRFLILSFSLLFLLRQVAVMTFRFFLVLFLES